MMQLTITAKVKINPIPEQIGLLQETLKAYRNGCNFVSQIIFEIKELVQAKLHKMTYKTLRFNFYL